MTMTSSTLLISNISEAAKLNFAELSERKMPDAILMCEPTHFDVIDIKNVFMQGQPKVDKALAIKQWHDLKSAIETTGVPVKTIRGEEGLEDMVFSANQVLVGVKQSGQKYIVSGIMKFASRQREVPHYLNWFRDNGYDTVKIGTADNTTNLSFEGHGDAIWHPTKMLLWGGYGHRTTRSAYVRLASIIDAPVLLLELVNDKFYHLDTCFCALDSKSVMIYPAAFSDDGRRIISHFFENVIEVDEGEASNFACNALAIGRNVFIEKGNSKVGAKLKDHGFNVIEVNTSEFMKSGGSVFCLTMDIYA